MENKQETKDIVLSAKLYKKIMYLGGILILLLIATITLAFYFYLKANNAQQQQVELKIVNQLQQEELENLNQRTQDLENKIQGIWQLQQEYQAGGSPRQSNAINKASQGNKPTAEQINKRLTFLEEVYNLHKPTFEKLQNQLQQRIITAQLNHYKGNPHIPTLWPTKGVISSPFGLRWNNTDFHPGIDIANDLGTPIMATADGVVTYAGWNPGGYGNMVDIEHGEGYMTRYAHASYVVVKTGKEIKRGQIIAYMGSTGFSTGPHLHYEVRIHNKVVNPTAYLLEQQ